MKRIFLFLMTVLTVVFMQVPFFGTAEAARVAVVPIQINDQLVERAADFNGYYWDIMIEKFKYPDYELMDDEKVAAVIQDEGLTSYDQATLMAICEKVDAEIVVAMRLDEVKETPIMFRREAALATFMKGEFASYNRITGNYFHKKMYIKGEIEEVLTLRTDWQQRTFASELKRYINRTIEDKAKKKKSK
jgi:predicted GTPase